MIKLRKILDKLYITVQILLIAIASSLIIWLGSAYIHDEVILNASERILCFRGSELQNEKLEKKCDFHEESEAVNTYLNAECIERLNLPPQQMIAEKCKIKWDGYLPQVDGVWIHGNEGRLDSALFAVGFCFVSLFFLFGLRRWLIWMAKD